MRSSLVTVPHAALLGEGTNNAATTALAIAGAVVLVVLLVLGMAWLLRVRRARRGGVPRDPAKPFAEP